MPKAGSIKQITFARRTSADAAATGKVLADFDFPAWLDGVATVLTVGGFIAVGGEKYKISLTMPSTLGRLRVDCNCLNPTTDTLDPDVLEGDITANEIDDVAILAARPPSVTLASNVSPQSAFTIKLFQGDGKTIAVPCYDDNGALLDLSLWENFRFSIKNAAQTAVSGQLPYNLAAGITQSAGFARVPIPEDCTAYLAHGLGRAETKLWWSLDANLITDTNTKTRTLRAGPFIIMSKETPSP